MLPLLVFIQLLTACHSFWKYVSEWDASGHVFTMFNRKINPCTYMEHHFLQSFESSVFLGSSVLCSSVHDANSSSTFSISTPLTPSSFTSTRILLFMSTTSSHTPHFWGYIAKKMRNVCAKQNRMPSNKHWNDHKDRCYSREKSWGETEGVLTYDSKATGRTCATLPRVLFTVKVHSGAPDSSLPSFCW